MKIGFKPIPLGRYVEQFIRANPTEDRTAVTKRLQSAIAASVRGQRCACGEPIWIIGSAEAGLACFTCITGEAHPDSDYEIDVDSH